VVTPHRIQWDELRGIIDSADSPRAIRLDGSPVVHLYFEPAGRRLGIRVPLGAAALASSPLAQVRVEARTVGEADVVEISTAVPALYPYFHGFAVSVADRVQVDQLDPNDAVNECVVRWRDLLRQAAMLSPERQLGLLGELWLLGRMISTRGPDAAIAAWTGPRRQAHDFRVEDVEIEVKTTMSEHRVHMISSDTQLVASPGACLYLLSLQYTAAGAQAGSSLASVIAEVRSGLGTGGLRTKFDQALSDGHGLLPGDVALYTTRLKLRTAPYLVPVDDHFPRISLPDLANSLDTSRISDVRYRVNVEGLGFADGSAEFTDFLGI